MSVINISALKLVATVTTLGEYDNADLGSWNGQPLSPTNQPTAEQDQLSATWSFYVDPNATNILYVVVSNVADTEYGYVNGAPFDLTALTGFQFSLNVPTASYATFSNQFATAGEALLGPISGSTTPLDSTPGWTLISASGPTNAATYQIGTATPNDAFTHYSSVYGETRISGGGVFEFTFDPSVNLLQVNFNTLTAVATNGEGAYTEIGTVTYAFEQPTIVVSGASTILTVGQTDLITFTFNEAISGFDNSDVTVSGGTLGTISQIDTDHYTATFTPTAGVIGIATIQVLASGTGTSFWTDLAGDTGIASNTLTIAEDTKLPTTELDRTHIQQNHTIIVGVAHGVVANDVDPVSDDALTVSAVNGQASNVGHAITGTYGRLTLNSDGSYSYAANHGGLPFPSGVGIDVFSYTATDGDGNSATSTLTVLVTSPGQTYLGGTSGTIIHGGFGIYVLDGSAGNDSVIAGVGIQTLIGGPNDTLTGALGLDTFVFAPNFGKNTITNFNPLLDSIQLPKSEFPNYAAVHLQHVGHDTVIANGPDSITLVGVLPSSLHASDFHFA